MLPAVLEVLLVSILPVIPLAVAPAPTRNGELEFDVSVMLPPLLLTLLVFNEPIIKRSPEPAVPAFKERTPPNPVDPSG
jgi:hypothetical protein